MYFEENKRMVKSEVHLDDSDIVDIYIEMDSKDEAGWLNIPFKPSTLKANDGDPYIFISIGELEEVLNEVKAIKMGRLLSST